MTGFAPPLPHILVVDDSGGVRRSLERSLSPYMRVTLAESVSEALRALTPCVQLVLSDILMPGESGLELAAILKREQPELPVVLFTGVVDAETRSRARSVGVETVLRKPLLTGPLLKVIGQWVGNLPGQVEEAPSGRAPMPDRPVPVPELRPPTEAQSDTVTREPYAGGLDEVCRKSGVLSAAQFTEQGELARQWNLPLPVELCGKAHEITRSLEQCADVMGSAWVEGQFMQLALTDRVLLLGKVEGKSLALVVRDSVVAAEVSQALRHLGAGSGRELSRH